MYIHKHGVLFPSDIWSDSIFGIEYPGFEILILLLLMLLTYIKTEMCVCVCTKEMKTSNFPKDLFCLIPDINYLQPNHVSYYSVYYFVHISSYLGLTQIALP